MFSVDVFNLRSERQKYNNLMISEELYYNSPCYKDLKKIANIKAVNRLLNELEFEYDDFLNECAKSIVYSKTAAALIAKNSTRQGKKDEAFILEGISNAMKKYKFNILSCGVNDYRPCKNGKMLSKKEFKKQNLNKDIHGLKSMDGIFNGPKNGYIVQKLLIGNGGHQDNVFREINEYMDWAKTYGESDKIYVMLIDGKEFEILKQKQTDNIWVVNHTEFQEKLLGK